MGLHGRLEFLQFELLVEEADLVEGVHSLREFADIVFYEFLEGLVSIDEPEESMIHNEVVETDLLLLLLPLWLDLCLFNVLVVGVVPQLFELASVDEFLLFDSLVLFEHVGVSPKFETLFDLTHLPLEFFIKIGDVLSHQCLEDIADLR